MYSRHQLDDEDPKISYKMHAVVRRMMSEKRQRRRVVRDAGVAGEIGPGITVTGERGENTGRVPGSNKAATVTSIATRIQS